MSLRVLLADESSTIKKVMQLALQDYGVEVKSVPLGIDVLQVAKIFQPDIVFADILLPKKSGYEVCSEIKKSAEFNQIPVVLMWSGFMDIDEERVTTSGANAHLEKPFDADILRSVVNDLVSRTQNNLISGYIKYPHNLESMIELDDSVESELDSNSGIVHEPQLIQTRAIPSHDQEAHSQAAVSTAHSQAPDSAARSQASDPSRASSKTPPHEGTSITPPSSKVSLITSPPPSFLGEDEIDEFHAIPLPRQTQGSSEGSHTRSTTPSRSSPPPTGPSSQALKELPEDWKTQDLTKFRIDLTENVDQNDTQNLFTELKDFTPEEIYNESFSDLSELSNVSEKSQLSEPLNQPLKTGLTSLPQNPEILELNPENKEALQTDGTADFTMKFQNMETGSPPASSRAKVMDSSPLNLEAISSEKVEQLVREQVREIIEGVAWKIIPDLAQRIIKEEIEHLMKNIERSESL